MYSPGLLMYKEHDNHLAVIIWPSVPPLSLTLFSLLKGAISLNITQMTVDS